jgi:hypothetical protein
LRTVFLLLRPDFGYYPVSFCCHIALTATPHLSPTFPRVIIKVLQKRCGYSYPGPQERWGGSGRNLRTRCNILSASATTRPCAVHLEIPSLYRSHPFQRSSHNLVKSLWESSPFASCCFCCSYICSMVEGLVSRKFWSNQVPFLPMFDDM